MTLKRDMEITFHSGYSDCFIKEFEFLILLSYKEYITRINNSTITDIIDIVYQFQLSFTFKNNKTAEK